MELYIPGNAKTQTEFWNGFGRRELARSAAGAGIGLAAAVILHLFFGRLELTITAILVSGGGSVMMCGKIENIGQSVVDIVIDQVRFARGQRIYPYRCLDEWDRPGGEG